MYNNTSKTNITCLMSELHQRNLYIYISCRGYRCRDRIIVLFISIYTIDSYDNERCAI